MGKPSGNMARILWFAYNWKQSLVNDVSSFSSAPASASLVVVFLTPSHGDTVQYTIILSLCKTYQG
jgi:hypothetical protein